MDFNPNLKSKAIKINYNETNNKMPKVPNFFRGDIVSNNNNKQPKRSSYDKKEIFYTSRIKESEIEPKLLLEKLPPAFNLKNQPNSNDSKKTSNTKYSSNEQRNNSHKKLTLSNSNETSPEDLVRINYSKSRKKEEYKKINNYFIEEEMNIQKQLQIKKNNNNKINNKRVTSFKLITKNNNNNVFQNNQGNNNNNLYEKNNYIYNNTNNTNNNNSHLKTDFSEYDNIKPKNNLHDFNIRDYLTNSTFKKNSEQKYKLNTININNLNNNYIYNNESLNTSDLPKKKYRKTSDPETYHTELKELKNTCNENKKNIRSGSYMNMINCQNILNILQTDSYYSPISTNANINTITNFTNNNFSMAGNTLREIDDFKLSGNSILQNILPHKKSANKMQKLKSSKYFNENIRSIKNITKIKKIPIITGGVFGNININLKLNSNGHRCHEHIESDHENIKPTKKEIENINEGISFRYSNGYKYYFNLRSANIYFLKEVQYNLVKGISTSINTWNKLFHKNSNYLKIISRKINTPENHYTFVIEYPKGGESINDIINSIGLHEKKYIYKIIAEMYKNILLLKNVKNNDIIQQYQNVPFCLCNIFLTINDEIKIMNPIMRKMNINSTKNNGNNNRTKKENNINICQCRKNFEKLKIIFNIHNNSLFCLGFSILQLITQNLLFKLKSYNILINQKNDQILNTNPKNCCLFHSLLSIEKNQLYTINNSDLKLSNFLYLYDSNLLNFIHDCTKYNNDLSYFPNSDFIENYEDTNNNINISIKELFKIISYIKTNDYISQNNFFRTFELLYKDMKINSINFKNLLHENKVINVLIRSFDIDKSEFKNKFRQIINIENNLEYDEYDENKNFVNSGSCFYRSSLRKKLENTGNKILNELNLENDNKIENNRGIIIFKNYNSNENI